MPAPGAPRLVMLVANGIEGDSRVQKSAAAARDAGYEVVVVGLAHRHEPGPLLMDGIPVLRIAPEYVLHERYLRTSAREEHDRLRRAELAAIRGSATRRLRATATPGPASDPRVRTADRLRARAVGAATAGLEALVSRAGGAPGQSVRSALARLRSTASPRRGWRQTWPLFVDYENAFTSVVTSLEPDLIHAHDIHLVHVADLAAGILRKEGRDCRWVYDAHEWIDGVPHGSWRQAHATRALEADHVGRADAVLTVSDELAARLTQRYGLDRTPVVVANSPDPERRPARGRQDLRTELGLGPSVPLLVYSGALAERRGIMTVLEALPSAPEVHLAIVANPHARYLGEVTDRARALGVGDRIHVRPYVPAESITWYLATADAGLAPFHRTTSHDLALATKVREYLHAGLPVIGSDCLVMADFLRSTGVGVVFTAQDAADLGRAIRELLADLEGHRARITEELRHEHSWPRDAAVLVGEYDRLLGRRTGAAAAASRTSATTRPRTVLLGVSRTAGRAEAWAEACARVDTRRGLVLAEPQAPRGPVAGLVALRDVVDGHAGAVLETGRPLLGDLVGGELGAEADTLERSGLDVSLLLHPEHARDPIAHVASWPGSYFLALAPDERALRERVSRRIRRVVSRRDLPVLVASPDLVLDVPGARWVPVLPALDAGKARRDEARVTVVVCAPHPRSAATDEVLAGLRGLAGADLDLVVLEDDRADAAGVAQADVLVDRVDLGTYSDAAVTAMAAGAAVLGAVRPEVREVVGGDLPVVDVEPAGVADAVRALVADRARRQALGDRGRAFVAATHSPSAVATALGLLADEPA